MPGAVWRTEERKRREGTWAPGHLATQSGLKSSGATASPSVSAAGCKERLPFRTHSMMPPVLTYFFSLVCHSSAKFRPFLQCVKVFVTFGEQRGEFSSDNVVQRLTSALHCQTAGKRLPEKSGATQCVTLFHLGTFLQVN